MNNALVDLSAIITLYAIVVACVAVACLILGMFVMAIINGHSYERGRTDEYERQADIAAQKKKFDYADMVTAAGKEFECKTDT